MDGFRLCAVVVAIMIAASTLWASPVTAQQASAVNRGVVEIETSSAAGISVRMAEDLANLVDDGATRRVVPVVGKGSLQSLTDLKYLRGIDLAILQIDVLDYAKEQRLVPGFESSLTYITRLYNEEFHLLAGPAVKSVTELANKRVNVDLRGGGTAITASRLFDLLKIPVTVTNDSQEVALDKLRRGEIAALAFVAGKPAPLFMGLKGDDGLHFLAVAELKQLQERYRNVANFVDVFFTGFQTLQTPGHHPKWQDVNLAAELPGWHRFPPAEQWLQRNMQVANAPKPDDLKAMFASFIDEHRHSAGGAPMTDKEKEDLFQQYS